MRVVEDWCVFISVDGHDHVRTFHPDAMLDGTGNSCGDVKFWSNGFTRLPYLALGFDPASLHAGASRTHFAAEDTRQIEDQLEVFRVLKALSPTYNHIRIRKVNLIAF
ncbi:hypothetical protein A9P79_27995 (plasmid) [Cupriavidus taiwanensis]|nr:hypothetical protein A9P79_27995 [Cupriavidus taiwanensis]